MNQGNRDTEINLHNSGYQPPSVSGQQVKGGLDLPRAEGQRPTESGFYYNDGSAQVMVYLLRADGQWMVVLDTGEISECAWEYIEQTTLAFPLKRLE